MKVILCYKEFELGQLTQDDGKYVFESLTGKSLAMQKYVIPRACKLLEGSGQVSDKLFGEYAYFLKLLTNPYIKSEANIIDGESDFEKLVKISRLNLDRGSFYLKCRP